MLHPALIMSEYMTSIVPRNRWGLAFAAFLIIFVGGLALIVLLAAGVANPPYAPRLALELTDLEGLQSISSDPNLHQYVIADLTELPYTLEAQAINQGDSRAVWGLWVESLGGLLYLLVDTEGYFYVDSGRIDNWRGFIHIKPDSNRLYLHVTDEANAVFRINDEIAWTGHLDELERWGIVFYSDSRLQWQFVRFYNRD